MPTLGDPSPDSFYDPADGRLRGAPPAVDMSVRTTYTEAPEFTYRFENFFHPHVDALREELTRASLRRMLDPRFLEGLKEPDTDPPQPENTLFHHYAGFYDRIAGVNAPGSEQERKELVKLEGHPRAIELAREKPYAIYNWELLFHLPVAIAVHLSKNQRFAEAQRWFHFVFDPTCNHDTIPAPQRFWKFLYFRQPGATNMADLVSVLSDPAADPSAWNAVLAGYQEILDDPFRPHSVARTRPLAYQYWVVMKYLDNLIAWGDTLFRQDTIESINEATQRYVLAANLLGERPQRVPSAGTASTGASAPMTFARLKALRAADPNPDLMGNALVELEGRFPFNLMPAVASGTSADTGANLFGIGRTFFFCFPRNDKMLGYWDTVADRLFKIRHCMNIEGVVRQLPLFDPPLDPGLLVKARAAGIDVGSMVTGLHQPLGPTRCLFLIQKALELCGEVRSLGAALLSAIEKADGEAMALLRQGHEIRIQQLAEQVRFLQWKQAEEASESLVRGRASALERYRYYQRLLGATPDAGAVPESLSLDRQEITEENFDTVHAALVGEYEREVPRQSLGALRLVGSTSPAVQAGAAGSGNLFLNLNEHLELNQHLPTARDTKLAASVANTIATVLTFIPEININAAFWGVGATSKVFGGSKLSDAIKIAADILQTISAWEQDQAGIASRTASYERRADDWILQSNLAAHELVQLGRQLIGSLIAEQAARREHLNAKTQVEQSEETDRFLHKKFTSAELYGWMQGELSRLYYEYYRFAFDTARKAERLLRRELMQPELDAIDFVKFNYCDGGRKGLLAGEGLYLDLKRMELAYHENNKREYELTKHVSLRQLDPEAFLDLKAEDSCEVTLPEWLFDLECPGQYARRLKSVSLSIPAVTGPYTSVNCTLTLLKSSIRKSPLLLDDTYARQGSEDPRFVDFAGATDSVVTSSGNNDGGLFETNLRDDRFLPFEGAGAISTWRLELPSGFRQFDYASISDVVLHIRYTARRAEPLKDPATDHTVEILRGAANGSTLALLLSLSHDFPTEWHRFLTVAGSGFAAPLKREHFPYFTVGRQIGIGPVQLFEGGTAKSDSGAAVQAASDGAFQISIPAAAIDRSPQAAYFLLVSYTLAP